MATCSQCGSMILFGGASEGDFRFCNNACLSTFKSQVVARAIPPDVLDRLVREVHQGDCPECHGPGPVDVYRSHRVWSALAFTRWSTRSHVCCRWCAQKKQLGDALFSAVLGWWGFPWGLIFTPVQVTRNLVGLVTGPDPDRPSSHLEHLVRVSSYSAPSVRN